MDILLDVVQVQPHSDFTLTLVFENQQRKVFDMSTYLKKKPFLKLKNKPLFMKATVQYGTVVWPGNIDIAPETLWDNSKFIESQPIDSEVHAQTVNENQQEYKTK